MSANMNPNIGKQLPYLQTKGIVPAEKVPKSLTRSCLDVLNKADVKDF